MKLQIRDLHVSVDGKKILKGLNLEVDQGEIHAIMGPNGSGKSTLSFVIMGHPKYKIESGDIFVDGKSITELSPDKRARLGLFLGFQYPSEVSGVSVFNFLRTSLNSTNGNKIAPLEFSKMLNVKVNEMGMSEDLLKRGMNEGFSGGEKKRNEIFQMAVLAPKLAVLDEPDSGTDVDGLKSIAMGICKTVSENKTGVILITHYNRILQHVQPHFVHVLIDGKIVKSGGPELAVTIEKDGYEKLR